MSLPDYANVAKSVQLAAVSALMSIFAGSPLHPNAPLPYLQANLQDLSIALPLYKANRSALQYLTLLYLILLSFR